MPRSLISVLLPVFNAKNTVGAALTSVLRQTYDKMEVIVVDDGSTDATPDVLADHAKRDQRITIIRTPNRGATAALNTGLGVARGNLIARMDADDISEPTRFEKQARHLSESPECVAVGCRVTAIDDNGVPVSMRQRAPTGVRLKDRCNDFQHFPPSPPTVPHPSVMIRSKVLKEIGGYRPYFRSSQDRDLWWRLSRKGEIHCLPEWLLRYRIRGDRVSRQYPQRSFADALIADLSAVATHFNLDDVAILEDYSSSRLASTAIEQYAQLLGPRYPTRQLATFRAVSRGFPFVAGIESRSAAVRYALAQLRRNPFSTIGYQIGLAALRR